MAKQIKGYVPKKKPGPDSPYPWDDWLEPGTEWVIEQGVDFTCTPESMTDIARRQARQREQSLTVHRDSPTRLVLVNPKRGG